MLSYVELKWKSAQIRVDILRMIHSAGAGHIGGALSSVDILVSLFYRVMSYRSNDPKWSDRDRFLLSKGHSCEGYYAILADCGFFPKEECERFMRFGGLLGGHPAIHIPGVEVCTGSLGHGLSVSVGMALAGKRDRAGYRVFCLMGDGEMAEGSVWEAASAASHYDLDNLVCIVDRNRYQISGTTEEILSCEPLQKRWESFGWGVAEVDGHDPDAIAAKLSAAPFQRGSPSLLIAYTVKGRGVSFMEGDPRWHHRVPDEDEYRRALSELSVALGGGEV